MRKVNIWKRVGIVITLVTMLATGAIWEVRRARAQAYIPTAPGLCDEGSIYDGRPGGVVPFLGIYNGYNAHGYIDGLLVHVVHEARYSGTWPDRDEDWNFYVRPIDKKTCPDGQQMMGRDCKRARQLYVDLIWGNSQEVWRAKLIDMLKLHGDFAGLTAQEKSLLVSSSGDNHSLAAEQVERKLWESIVLDPDRFDSFYWHQPDGFSSEDFILEAEVATSPDPASDEFADPNHMKLINFENLQPDCQDTPTAEYPHGCDIHDALFYGTITTDLNHDEGKVEMHPIRAIVTNDDRADLFDPAVFKSANPPITTTIRAFADYGKAGDNGSGSVAGRICEHWLQNTFDPNHQLPHYPPYASLNGGAYRSYITITPDAFEFPKLISPGGGKAPVVERACNVSTLIGIPLQGTLGGLGVSVPSGTFSKGCPGIAADPAYIANDGEQRLFGGWWAGVVVTRNKYEGNLTLTATQKSDNPVPLGVITAGSELEKGVKAPSTARYYKVVAQAEAKLETGASSKALPIDKLDVLKWEVSANVTKVPQANGIVNLYLAVGPAKDKSLDRYKLAAVAVASYQKRPLTSNKLQVAIPRPRVSAKATYALEVKTGSDGKKSLVYKPTFHATGTNFIEGGAAFTWTQGKTKLGTGKDITLSLTDANIDTKIRVEGTDTAKGGPYETASAALKQYIPEVEVAAPEELQKKGGTPVKATIKKVGATAIPCASADGLPATGYPQVTLVADMKVPKNPYNAPGPLSPVYTWGPVQLQSGDDWTKFAGVKASGTGNNTLTITIDKVKGTDDLTALSQFRVKLSVVDGYGRTASTLVHFTNWDASDAVKATNTCFDDEALRLSNIPKYDWGQSGVKDPINDPPDVIRDKNQPLRDPVLLSRLRTLYDSPGDGKLTARSPAPAAAAPSASSKKARALGGTAIFEGIEKAKHIAPVLR